MYIPYLCLQSVWVWVSALVCACIQNRCTRINADIPFCVCRCMFTIHIPYLHDVGHFVPSKRKEAGVIPVEVTPSNHIRLLVHCPLHLAAETHGIQQNSCLTRQ